METMDVTDWIVLTTRLPAWKPQTGPVLRLATGAKRARKPEISHRMGDVEKCIVAGTIVESAATCRTGHASRRSAVA